MEQSTNCITCLECVKSCEKENVSLSLRPWGEDLRRVFLPKSDEAALALVLVALTGFHGFTMTPHWTTLLERIQDTLSIGDGISFTLGMAGLTALPIAVYALLVAVSWRLGCQPAFGYKRYFVRYAYSLLPIALFYHLAHNSEHLLMESQKIVPLVSDPLGRGWDLFGTAQSEPAPLVSLTTLWGIQVALVLIGHLYSLAFGRRVAHDIFPNKQVRLKTQLPILAAMVLFSIASLWLLKQPMQMRVSAM